MCHVTHVSATNWREASFPSQKSKISYKVLSQVEGGHPSNLRPKATVAPSIQHPNLVSPQVKYCGQPSSKGPIAALNSSGQHPKVVLSQSTKGGGLHRFSPKMSCNSSLVNSLSPEPEPDPSSSSSDSSSDSSEASPEASSPKIQ